MSGPRRGRLKKKATQKNKRRPWKRSFHGAFHISKLCGAKEFIFAWGRVANERKRERARAVSQSGGLQTKKDDKTGRTSGEQQRANECVKLAERHVCERSPSKRRRYPVGFRYSSVLLTSSPNWSFSVDTAMFGPTDDLDIFIIHHFFPLIGKISQRNYHTIFFFFLVSVRLCEPDFFPSYLLLPDTLTVVYFL